MAGQNPEGEPPETDNHMGVELSLHSAPRSFFDSGGANGNFLDGSWVYAYRHTAQLVRWHLQQAMIRFPCETPSIHDHLWMIWGYLHVQTHRVGLVRC